MKKTVLATITKRTGIPAHYIMDKKSVRDVAMNPGQLTDVLSVLWRAALLTEAEKEALKGPVEETSACLH